jgi:hypothetical protein
MSNISSIYINGVLQHPSTYTGKGTIQLTGKTTMSQSTVNLNMSNLSHNTTNWLNTLSNSGAVTFDLSDQKRHHEVKKYEVYESPEDVLVLSATWKRMRDEGRYGIVAKLMDRDLFKEITPADRALAGEIRDYYSKKIMMWNLKGNQITSYRKDLSKLIHSDGTVLREDMMGIAYHLPAFYQYDQDFEEIRMSTTHNGLTGSKLDAVIELEPIKRMFRKTKNHMCYEYWFRNKKDGAAYMLGLNTKNPLQHVWDNLFDNTEVLPIHSSFLIKNKDDFQYYMIADKWQLKMA